ncbi:MAG: glycerol kinase GlpK [Bacteroidetes bacterium]|nr:glycerol kinase GlpK [Bacteroidota bacterium]
MPLILSLDQGTTSSRAIVFNGDGETVGVSQKEFRQFFPEPGHVEHDAVEIWSTQIEVARDVISRSGVSVDEIAAVAITNQRETTVVWDRDTGKPIHNALVWQDRRTARYCDDLRRAGHEPLIAETTGLVIDPYFSATKLKWILDNVSGARDRAAAGNLAFGTIDTWLLWNLTGGRVHATDATNASRTMLMNIATLRWDDTLLELFDIPQSILPEIRSSSEEFGRSTREIFGAEIPIAGIAGDQHAALFGQQCTEPGMAKNTYGTGCFLLRNTGSQPVRSANRLLTTIAVCRGSTVQYALEGSVFVGGAVVQWLRDGLELISDSREIESLANSVPDSGGVVFVPAFTGLGAPWWDPYARGAVFGITRGTTRAHIARAALESIALQSADVLNAMNQDTGEVLRELRVDGGAARNNLLMQLQADTIQVPVVRSATTEATALGAAFLAGLAVGVWKNDDELRTVWRSDNRFSPRGHPDALRALWDRGIDRTKNWIQSES